LLGTRVKNDDGRNDPLTDLDVGLRQKGEQTCHQTLVAVSPASTSENQVKRRWQGDQQRERSSPIIDDRSGPRRPLAFFALSGQPT
jgi:hypothetical protein